MVLSEDDLMYNERIKNNSYINKKRKHKRKRRKIFFLIIILLVCIFFGRNIFRRVYGRIYSFVERSSIAKLIIPSPYTTIKMDTNENYDGIGQEKISGEGYFTKFTTVDANKKTYIEYKQNLEPWKDNEYWNGNMEDYGCGITAMSIVLSGYGSEINPENLRTKYYPRLDYANLSKELKSYGIDNTDFYFDSKSLSEESIINHLKTNRPIIICLWNKPEENRFTSKSHYMVLLAATDDGKIYISNPNGGENDYRSSGWYYFDEISPYLAKAMYITSY